MFDKTGMVVEAIYDNGEKKQVENYLLSSNATSKLDKGETTITIGYTEGDITKTTTITVTAGDKTLNSISVKTSPKTNYYVGDTFDLTGLVLTATYNNGISKRT